MGVIDQDVDIEAIRNFFQPARHRLELVDAASNRFRFNSQCQTDANRAQELATSALETFTQSRTRYDITHARVTLSRAALASGQERPAIQQGALARSAVQVMGRANQPKVRKSLRKIS